MLASSGPKSHRPTMATESHSLHHPPWEDDTEINPRSMEVDVKGNDASVSADALVCLYKTPILNLDDADYGMVEATEV